MFQRNLIATVGHNLLVPLTKLHFARFTENDCIDKIALNRTEIPALQAALNAKCPEA
jgi:hypothetical protein